MTLGKTALRLVLVGALVLSASGVATAVTGGAPAVAVPAPTPPDDPARGLHYGGLHPSNGLGPCKRGFELHLAAGDVACSHGPDPAPAGVDVRQDAPVPVPVAVSADPTTALAAVPPCQGDGVSGPRVQLVYAHAADVADRYSTFVSSFQQWAAGVDDVFNLSAAETGGVRHVRFVHDASCVPTVLDVALSSTGDDTLTNTINELRAAGLNRSDRKYLVWMDATVYCGIAQVYNDDRAGQDNPNNGRSDIPGMVARVDAGCWGTTTALVEAHELTHTLGSVQPTAPNASPNGHCTDEYDRMCYSDAAGVTMRTVCPSTGHENRLDCNHDDYFSTAPPAGSWLATHWNTAASAFLAGSGTTPSTTSPPTTSPPTTTTTTTTKPPATTTTTTAPAPTTTTTKPPATTTTTVPPSPAAQNARFTDRAYRDLYGRAPSSAELSFWMNTLAGGYPRSGMATILTTSTEYRRLVVDSYYRTYLARAPLPVELDALVNAIGQGWPFEWVSTLIMGGDEFYARSGSNPVGFVQAVSTFCLGSVDPAGVTYWVDQIVNKGLDRYSVALAFLTWTGTRQNVVKAGYGWFLDRPPTVAEVSAWTSALNAGTRQEAFFATLIASNEYYSTS